MYFDAKPKKVKKDLFDFEAEYKKLKDCITDHTTFLIVVKGLRRTGKTSLLKVIYNEIKFPKVFIDLRSVNTFSYKSIENHFVYKIEENIEKDLLKKIRNRIKEISLSFKGVGVKFDISKRSNLRTMLSAINDEMKRRKGYFIIFIDEVQELKPSRFDRFIAYVLDNTERIKFVCSGSQIGVLDKFIGETYDTPLYGRAKEIINTRKLKHEESIEFLKKGFRQIKKKRVGDELEEVVEKLDGIIGWLVLYGSYSIKHNHKDALNAVFREGRKTTMKEIEKFLKNKGSAKETYSTILKGLSREDMKWGEIKDFLIIKLKKEYTDSKITKYLTNLEDYGFISKVEKKYHIDDPLIKSLF